MRATVRAAISIAAAVALFAGGTVTQAAPGNGKKQKPSQVHPTGKEDAPGVPSAEELQLDAELEQMVSRSSEGLQKVVHADGMVSVDLEGRFMHVSVAGAGHDGKAHANCVSSAHALAKARKAPAPRAASETAAKTATPALEVK